MSATAKAHDVPQVGARIVVALLILASGLAVVVTRPEPAEAAIRDPFDPVFSTDDNGATLLTGNSQMTCPPAASGCTAALTFPPATTTSVSGIDNNSFAMQFLDTDGSPETTNSTSADVDLPDGSAVLYARLLWGGRRTAGTGGAAAGAGISQVKLRAPGESSYATLTATTTIAPNLGGFDAMPYQASLDVTSLVRSAGNGTYWVGDIQAATGLDRYAGWSLIVTYRNPALPLRRLMIFEGFADVTTTTGNNNVTIPISGFLTPAAGPVNVSVGFVAWDGDRGIRGEQARLNGVQLANEARPPTNFFDSSITDAGANITERSPNTPNTFGIDVARTTANGVLPNAATSTTVSMSTGQDGFYPGIVTARIDLASPAFNPVSKAVVNLSGNDPAQAGDTLEYRVLYENTGQDFADNAVVRDVLPSGVTFVPDSLLVTASPAGVNDGAKTDAAGDAAGEYLAASRTVQMRIGTGADAASGGTLDPNAAVAFSFRVTVDRAAAGTTISNSTTLGYRARAVARDFTFAGNVVDTPVAGLADLALTKTSSPASQTAGNPVSYVLTATNNGPSPADEVNVFDVLPDGLAFTGYTAPAGTTCSADGQTVVCTLGTVAVGASREITISTALAPDTAPQTLVNQAAVYATTSDDDLSNNSATATTLVTSSADLGVTKDGPTGDLAAGSTVPYTVTVTNAGPSTAAAVTLTDPVPQGTTFVSATSTVGTCELTGGLVSCAVGDLAPSATATATITVRIGSGFVGTTLANTATVASSTPDPDDANNTASVSKSVSALADVRVAMEPSPTTAAAGELVIYTVTVDNDGPSDAADVVVDVPAVAGLTFVGVNADRGACTLTAGTASCSVGTLNPGARAVLTIEARIDQARPPGPLGTTATGRTPTPQSNTANDTASASVDVTTSADLALTKIGPGTITGGTQVTYTLQVTNIGPSQATGVTLTDTLPAGLTLVSSPDGCTASGTTVTCPVGEVAAGAVATREFVVQAAPDLVGTVANTASVSATTPDPNAPNNSSTYTSNTAGADVAVTKAAEPASLVAGGPVTYTLVVSNDGPADAQGVTLSDPLPDGVTFSSVAASTGTCGETGGTVSCSFGALAPGDSRTVTIEATVEPDQPAGSSTNTASATSTSPIDPTTSNNTATTVSPVNHAADIGIVLTALNSPVTAGTFVDYQAVVTNNGPSTALDTVATGTVPDGLIPEVGSSGGLCTLSGQTVICELGTLAPGASVTIPLRARVRPDYAPGPLSATGIFGSSTPDPNPDNDFSTATIQVVAAADLRTTKNPTTSPLVAGADATYTIEVVNDGPSDATAVSLVDILPGELTPLSASPTFGNCDITGQTVSCSADHLPAGSTLTVTLQVRVAGDAGTSVSNTATAASATADPGPGPNSATATTDVGQFADVRVAKLASPEPVRAGTAVTYTVTITNVGPSNAAAVTLSDPLPAGLTALPGGLTSDGDACTADATGTEVSCAFGTVLAGDSRTLTVEALVPETAVEGSTITNTATASSPTPDLTPGTRTATATSTVTTEADVVVLKTPLDLSVVAGDPHGYLISVRNDGPSLARGVVLTDPLPPGATFVSAITDTGTCAAPAGTLTCDLGDLPRGEIVVVQLTIRTAPDTGETALTNTASAVSAPPVGDPTPDPDPANNTSGVTQLVNRRADITLTKTPPDEVVAGGTVTYELAATNAGPSDTTNMFIADTLPPGTSLSSATASDDGTCALTAGVVRCTWPSAPLGASRTATLVLGVPANMTGATLTNTATAGSDAIDPTPAEATTVTPVIRSADVAIVKSVTPTLLVPGRPATFALVVTNAGPSTALATTVTDDVPAGLDVGSVTTTAGSCAVAGQLASCTLGEVAVGVEIRIEIQVAVPSDLAVETYANTATAVSETDDPDASDNSSTVNGAVLPLPDLSVTKDDGVATIQAGDQVTYTITVTNSGNIGATGVVVTDPLPAGTTFVSCTVAAPATCGESPAGSGTVAATIPLVPRDGGQAVIALTMQVAAGQPAGTDSITNTVTVSDDGLNGPERSTQNNSVSDTDALVFGPGPALAIAKDDGLERVEGGDTVTYTVTVTNAGDQDAADAVVTDTLAPGTTFVSCTLTPAAPCAETAAGSGVVEATLPVVPSRQAGPDAEVTLAITVTIDDPVAAGTTEFVNTAEVAHPDDQTSDDNTATDRDTYGADVAVDVDDGVDVVVPGQTVTYTVTLTNNGSSRVDTVTLTTDMSPELVDRSFAEAPATLAGEAAAPLPSGGFGRSFAAAALPPALVDATFAAATGSFDPTTGEWTDLALAPGEVAALSLTARVDPAARGQVTATVTAALPAGFTDPILGNNTNDDIDTLAPRAGVSLAKDGPAASGGILPFTGANVLWLARAALALVAVGALLRAGTIRRRA